MPSSEQKREERNRATPVLDPGDFLWHPYSFVSTDRELDITKLILLCDGEKVREILKFQDLKCTLAPVDMLFVASQASSMLRTLYFSIPTKQNTKKQN